MVMLMDTECISRLHREQGINRAQSGTRIQRWWGTFATCSAENEKRSPEGGGGGMKVQEDLYRVISYRRANWSFEPAWRYRGGIFHNHEGMLDPHGPL